MPARSSAFGIDRIGLARLLFREYRVRRRARLQLDAPKVIARKLISDDDHIARPMDRLHADESIIDDIIGHDDMVTVDIDTLRGILNIVTKDLNIVCRLTLGHLHRLALVPAGEVLLVPHLL